MKSLRLLLSPPPLALATALLALGGAGPASAAVVVSTLNETGVGPFSPSYGDTVGTNALSGLTPTSSTGNFTLENTSGVSVLTDGAVGPVPAPEGPPYPNSHRLFASTGPSAGSQVTYSLAMPTVLTLIGVYGGWSDGGRDNQAFTIEYSIDNGLSYATLVAATNTVPTNPPSGQVSATRTFVTDDAGPLANGDAITNLRFSFTSIENGWTGTSEIIAVPAAVPEPGAAALSLLGLAAFARRRRK